MARRRRVNRGTWFPVDPSYTGENPVGNVWYEGTLPFNSSSDPGDTTLNVTPLILDKTPQVDTASIDVTLRDYVEGQDALIERIVGKVWFNAGRASDGRAQGFLACIGIAVLPVDDNQQDTPALEPEDYNPLIATNVQQPWLWRRTWRFTNAFGNLSGLFPSNTGQYGSVLDGGHVDTKGTKRRIRKEERLFLVAAATVTDVQGGEVIQVCDYGYDLRILGQMRRGRNASSFK